MADGSVVILIEGDDSPFQSTLGNLGNAAKAGMKAVGAAIGGVTAALSGAAAYAVKVGGDFEAAMSKVSAISGATGEELQALTNKAKEMGAKTKFSATESADALSYMAMAGWKTEDMLGGLEGVMNLAAASGEDLAKTSDIVTDALTAFGMGAGESGRFADVLAAASSNANTNVGLMGETFRYVAPVAGALGYAVEDTAVAIGLMANAGIKGSQAGTALRAMLTNLAKPSEQVAGYMDDLCLSLTDAAGNVKPLGDLLQDLREKFAGLTEAQKAEYAAGIAGQEGMSGLLSIVNATQADFQKLTSAIQNSNGAAEEMAAVMNDNLQGAVTVAKSGLEGLGISIYESLEGPLKTGVQSATGAIQKLQSSLNAGQMKAAMDTLAQGLGDVVGGLAKFAASAVPQVISAAAALVKNLDKIAVAGKTAVAAFAAFKVASTVGKLVTVFQKAARHATEFAASQTASAIATGVSTGAIKVHELAVAVLTGKMGLLAAVQAAVNGLWAANPVGMVALGVAALTAGIVGLVSWLNRETAAEKESRRAMEEKTAAIQERNLAWEDSKSAVQENIDATTSEIALAEQYIKELRGVTDENGRVKAGYEGRAAALYSLINEAIPGAISANQDEEGSIYQIAAAIDEVIAKKKAEAVLSSMEDQYAEAVRNWTQAQLDAAQAEELVNQARKNGSKDLEALEANYEAAKARADEYFAVISQYEGLQAAVSQGSQAINLALQEIQTNFKTAGNATVAELEEQARLTQAAYENMLQRVAQGNTDITQAQLAMMQDLANRSHSELETALEQQKASVAIAQQDLLRRMTGDLGEFTNAGRENMKGYGAGIAAAQGDAQASAAQVKAMCEAALTGDTSQYGADFIQGFLQAILHSNPTEPVRAMVREALNAIPATQKSHSPSQITMGYGQDFTAGYVQGITGGTGGVLSAVGQLTGAALHALGVALPQFSKGGGALTAKVAEGAKGATDQAETTIKGLGQALEKALNGFQSNFSTVGGQLVSGLIQGIRNMGATASAALGGLVSQAIGAAKKAAGIASPSRVMRDAVGLMLAQGLAVGIRKGKQQVLDAQEEVCTALIGVAESEIGTLNEAIAKIQDAAQARQTKKERETQEKAVQEKYKALEKLELEHQEKLAKAKAGERAKLERDYLEDREKLLADIAKLEADWKEKQLKAQEQAQQEALKSSIASLEEIQKEYEKARGNIDSRQDRLAEKVADAFDLYAIDNKTGKLSLTDINKSVEEIEKYHAALNALKEQGADNVFLGQFESLSVEEGIKYAEKLVNMEQGQFDAYLEAWDRQNAAARELAAEFFADQIKSIDEDFAEKLNEHLVTVPETMSHVGQDAIQGMADGMKSKTGLLARTAQYVVRQAINAMKMAADIHSPSRKTRDLVGKPMGEGVGVGFQKALPLAMSQARAAVELETAHLSMRAAAKANANAAPAAPPEVRTYYQRERIENTPTLNITGDLAGLMRVLYPHWEKEHKRRGGNLVKGGGGL